uniref:Uncharacterized protein n=1 Tax=Hyaloperonospora arabidopsidis (strain Emoy2) TaxID=559515 RepID=M4BV90_HYAAE
MDGIVVLETQYSKKFMLHIMRSIDYSGLCYTTKELNHPEVPTLPEQISMDDLAEQDDLLQLIHRVLFDVKMFHEAAKSDVKTNCGRSYPVSNAVPNMLLEEDEL